MLSAHTAYDETNMTLHGRVAADALRPAIETGGSMLDRALEVMRASRVTRVGVNLANCKEATARLMRRVQAALIQAPLVCDP